MEQNIGIKKDKFTKVKKIVKIFGVILIVFGLFYVWTILVALLNYSDVRENISILNQKYVRDVSLNSIIISNLLTLIFLIISSIGLIKLQGWAMKFFYWVAIWFFLFYMGMFNLLLLYLGGGRISIYRQIGYIILGLMGLYVYRNKEVLKVK